MSALSFQYFIKKSFLRSRTASLVGSNRISRRRRTAIGIMIFLYSPFSNACTRTSLAMFQMKENRWLYCAVFIRYKNNHFLRKSDPPCPLCACGKVLAFGGAGPSVGSRLPVPVSCGLGAKMSLAYATRPFSVPHCSAMASRTTEGPILYDASGTAAAEPPLAHR